MENTTIKVSLGTIKEKRKITDSVKAPFEDVKTVNVSCDLCLKAYYKDGRIHYTYKAGEVKKQLRFHPGYATSSARIYVTNTEGKTVTILLSAKIVV